jgi:Ca-activated chloride channel family protein
LREIAESTGGFYVSLTSGGIGAMQQLYNEGISKMQAGDIDARTSRQPIERYQWPLAAAVLALAASMLMNERKAVRRVRAPVPARATTTSTAVATAAILLVTSTFVFAAAPGLNEYESGQFPEAYKRFEQTLQEHPQTHAADKIQFDAGAAAYKMKDYNKALESFSQALLSPEVELQSRSHYNLGNTLYERGEAQKKNDDKLRDWTNALQHYEQTLKMQPDNKDAKDNYDYVKNKIDELKKQQEQQPSPSPSPTPSPSPSPNKNDKDKNKQDKNDQQNSKDKNKDKQQNQDQQQQQDKSDQNQDKSQQQNNQNKDDQQKPGQSPSPSPQPGQSPSPSPSPGQGSSPSPSPGDQGQASPSPSENGASPSPSPSDNQQAGASPTPSPGEGENEGGEGASPSPTASPSPPKQGDVKGAGDQQPQEPKDAQEQDAAEAEQTEENQMSPQQAERLLRAMRDEEKHVQLDERKAARRVYKDW